MNQFNFISLITWIIFLFPGLTVSADYLVLARDQHFGAFSMNSFITRPAETRSSRLPESKDKYNLVWTHIPRGGALSVCFSDSWSISSTEIALFSEDENQESEPDKHCKTLVFLETSGMTRLQLAATAAKLPPPVLRNLNFKGVIAFEPRIESKHGALPLTSYALQNIVIHVRQNETSNAFTMSGGDTDRSHALPSTYSYGGGNTLDSFDQKRPPALPFPGAGSEMTLSLILPENSTYRPESGLLIHVEILSHSDGPIVLTLTHDEALILQEAGILTKPSILLSYFQKRSFGLRNWFNQREVLEDVLNAEAEETDTNIYESYINNLIASLNELSVTITPDDPHIGSVPVDGIIGAMMGEQSAKEGSTASGKKQDTASSSGLSRRPTGSEGKSPPLPERAEDEGEKDPPEDHKKEEEVTDQQLLDIRQILGRCRFDQYFNLRPDYVMAGLFAYGQLTVEQLQQLSEYDPSSDMYNVKVSLSSDDLISILEEGNETVRAASLSVLRWLDRKDKTQLYHGVLSYAPKQWQSRIAKEPEKFAGASNKRQRSVREFIHSQIPGMKNMRPFSEIIAPYRPGDELLPPQPNKFYMLTGFILNKKLRSEFRKDHARLSKLIPALQSQVDYIDESDSEEEDSICSTDEAQITSPSSPEEKRDPLMGLVESMGISQGTSHQETIKPRGRATFNPGS